MKYTSPYRHRMIPVRTVMETEYQNEGYAGKERKDRQKEQREIGKILKFM